jgi:hypothetical protein
MNEAIADPREVQRHLRAELRLAVVQGVIVRFDLRPKGRATLYWPEGPKRYTTGTLDTLTALEERRRWQRDVNEPREGRPDR